MKRFYIPFWFCKVTIFIVLDRLKHSHPSSTIKEIQMFENWSLILLIPYVLMLFILFLLKSNIMQGHFYHADKHNSMEMWESCVDQLANALKFACFS